MADNPYEHDNPYEPLEPEPPASAADEAPDAGVPDDDAGSRVSDDADPPSVDRPAEPEPQTHEDAPSPDTTVTSTFDVREAGRRLPGGAHEAERPVPRSGLTEQASAGYLTGERRATDDTRVEESPSAANDDGGTSPAALAGAAGAGAAGGAAVGQAAEERRPRREVVLDGTTALTRPPSRTGAHVGTVVLSLLLTPIAWYLLADTGARLTLPANNPWESGEVNVAALLELGGGLVVLAVVLLAARSSSLGATVTGLLVLAAGVPFVVVPAWTQENLAPALSWLAERGDLGGNVAHHLVASGSTGRFVVFGLALVLVGAVSHGARRRGRRDVRPAVDAA